MQAITQQLVNARAKLMPVAGSNAALEARLLAAHAWDMSVEELVLCGNEARSVQALDTLVARRLSAEPVAQIVGEKHFWKDTFNVSADVLTPRADSETMIEALLRLRPNTDGAYRILDLGTGSGCLLLSALREYTQASAVGVDQSPAALKIAAQNATTLHLDSRCEFLRSDWCSKVEGTFDIVLANPPYIPTADIAALDDDVKLHEPHAALDGGADGLDCFRRIVMDLAPHVKLGALVLFEVGQGQADDVAVIGWQLAGWNLIEYATDLAGIARVVALEVTPNS